MSDPFTVDLFVEDRAHEAFLVPLIERIAAQEGLAVAVRVRSARGGHGRALQELKLYQRLVEKGVAGAGLPDVLVAAVDGNCSKWANRRDEIRAVVRAPFLQQLVTACPDPHIERWYLADPEAFLQVVGSRPSLGKTKCERDYYKKALADAVREGGHPPTLGGIELARELAWELDLYRAGRAERSLKAFVEELRAALRAAATTRDGQP